MTRTEMKMLLGATDSEIIVATLSEDTDTGHLYLNNEYYDNEPFTESEGIDRARESLEDGELWKNAVQNDNTTESKEDWIDTVMNADGWQSVLGDISEIEGGKYVFMRGIGGAFDGITPSDFTAALVPNDVISFIYKLNKKGNKFTPKEEEQLKKYFIECAGDIDEFDPDKEYPTFEENKIRKPKAEYPKPIADVEAEYEKERKRMNA